LLREIFETDIHDELGKIVLYNRILLLVEKVLNRLLITEMPIAKTKKLKEEDMDGLKEVESILSEKELEKFPSINNLSRIAFMSSSKLKKRFKEVYGMKLYEFYNHNRLSKARKMDRNRGNQYKRSSIPHRIFQSQQLLKSLQKRIRLFTKPACSINCPPALLFELFGALMCT
jgi:AraC-like DNA-binding protein